MYGLRLLDRLVFPDLNLITRNGISVRVEPKAMEVLLELAKRPGEVVSKSHMMKSVWNGVFVCEDVVTNAISLLRRALGDEAKSPSLIQTIPKHGYRLIAPALREPALNDTIPPSSTALVSRDSSGSQVSHGTADSLPGDLNRAILRVRYLRHEETVQSLNSACAYCEEIILQEPNCAAAYAELVLTLFLLEKLGAVGREEIEPRVRNAVEHALRLGECASMTLVCLAKQEYRYDWKWEKAEQHFKRAAEIDPAEPHGERAC
jgi:DNA-binding winged helix-turn-helix (wHTH) protein